MAETPASGAVAPFVAPRVLRNGHAMTLTAALWPRRFPFLPPAEPLLLEVAPETRVRLDCHWQPDRAARPALVLVHGLEGSSESHYILGTAEKAWRAGWSAIRMNVRNCGGTEALTPTLYHSGLSGDVGAVAAHLLLREKVPEVHLAGFSMGGNQVLKLAGEWGAAPPSGVASVAAVSPAIDLARCADALGEPQNFLYQWNFVRGLTARLRRKARLFPGRFATDGLARIRTVREFDDLVTAPYSGFGTADGYYSTCNALRVVERIALPTLVVAAEDDPFVPFESFRDPRLVSNPHVTRLETRHGGHVGFVTAAPPAGEDHYWAENRVLEFCRRNSRAVGKQVS